MTDTLTQVIDFIRNHEDFELIKNDVNRSMLFERIQNAINKDGIERSNLIKPLIKEVIYIKSILDARKGEENGSFKEKNIKNTH